MKTTINLAVFYSISLRFLRENLGVTIRARRSLLCSVALRTVAARFTFTYG